MIQTHHVIGVVIVLFVALMIFSRTKLSGGCGVSANSTEKFDAHRNHSVGAQSIYRQLEPDMTLDDAELKAKYDWSHRNRNGMNVYDSLYETKEYDDFYEDRGYDKLRDVELARREIDSDMDNQYDLKFDTKSKFRYSQHGMRQPQMRGAFNGNIITLAQKLKN